MAKTHHQSNNGNGGVVGQQSTSPELTPELADLLSEFHLLKDVSHPNVVQLLGACTDPGGPFLLLLEYCEHGSLRNYLRRARLSSTTTTVVQQANELQAHHQQPVNIQPRDLLSFAWQISQAGAYLCEMKVVLFNKSIRFSSTDGSVCFSRNFSSSIAIWQRGMFWWQPDRCAKYPTLG